MHSFNSFLKGPIPDKIVSASSSHRLLLLSPAPQPPAPALALAVPSDIVSGTTRIAIADDIKAPMASLVIHFRNVGASGIEVRARVCTSWARASVCARVRVSVRMYVCGVCVCVCEGGACVHVCLYACLCLRMRVFSFVPAFFLELITLLALLLSPSLLLSYSRPLSRSVTHARVSVSSVMHR
jgi:hypothetical protein